MSERAVEKSSEIGRWVIWGLVVTFLSIRWSDSLHWVNWKRKGQQNVFWEEVGGTKPPSLLPKWLFLTIPLILLFQLIASIVVVWRTKKRRLALAMILLVLWLVSFVFSFQHFHYN